MEEFRAIYEAAFARPEAQLALLELAELAQERPTALLCFCANGAKCHRSRIAQALEDKGFRCVEIDPAAGA